MDEEFGITKYTLELWKRALGQKYEFGYPTRRLGRCWKDDRAGLRRKPLQPTGKTVDYKQIPFNTFKKRLPFETDLGVLRGAWVLLQGF